MRPVALALVFLAALPAAAADAMPGQLLTSSRVTAPANGTPISKPFDGQAGGAITVSGDTVGTASTVDVRCYSGTSSLLIAGGVPVSNNAFSVAVPLATFANAVSGAPLPSCVLRAVLAGDTNVYPPGGNTPYTGPRVGLGRDTRKTLLEGPNAGAQIDFDAGQAQGKGSMEFWSIGDCGLGRSILFDPVTLAQSEPGFWCNGAIEARDGAPEADPANLQATRPSVIVDGANAYEANGAAYVYTIDDAHQSRNLGAYPAQAAHRAVDPATGDMTVDEDEELVRCAPDATAFRTHYDDADWPALCSSFTPVGVRLHRRIVQDHDGLRAVMTDTFTSTDGKPHAVDLEMEETFHGVATDSIPPTIRYGWLADGFTTPVLGDEVLGPHAAGPVTLYADGSGAAADSPANPQMAVTYDRPPASARWVGVRSFVDLAMLRFSLDVPPGGGAVLRHAYNQAATKDDVVAAARAQEDGWSAPAPTPTPTPIGSTSGGTPPGTPSGQPQPPDTAAPTVRLAVRRARLRDLASRGLRARLTCTEACRYTVIATLAGRGRAVLARATGSATSRPVTVKLELTARGRRALRGRRSARIAIAATAIDAAGNTGTANAVLAAR